MTIPAPGTDEDATSIYGIRKPKSSQKAKWIWRAIARIADDVEAALQLFGLPPVVVTNTVAASSSGARDAHFGVPATFTDRLALQNSGAVCIRTDKGWTERYFAALTDGGANPGGTVAAGWYPVSGVLPKYQVSDSTNWGIGTSYATVDTWATLVEDRGAGLSSFAAGVATIAIAGVWEIEYYQRLSTSSQTNYGIGIAINGALDTQVEGSAATAEGARDIVRVYVNLAVGSTVQCQARRSPSGNATTRRFRLRYVGPN
jgi:hypothetical protein